MAKKVENTKSHLHFARVHLTWHFFRLIQRFALVLTLWRKSASHTYYYRHFQLTRHFALNSTILRWLNILRLATRSITRLFISVATNLHQSWNSHAQPHWHWHGSIEGWETIWLGDATEGLIWCSSLAKSSTTSDTDQHQLRLGIHTLLYNCQLTSKMVPNQRREQSSWERLVREIHRPGC